MYADHNLITSELPTFRSSRLELIQRDKWQVFLPIIHMLICITVRFDAGDVLPGDQLTWNKKKGNLLYEPSR
jgi:hypothetical protein